MYDAFAGAYGSHARTSPYNALYDRPALLGLAGDVAGRRVLDAGCGPGIYAADLVARGAHVTAFDESLEMVRWRRTGWARTSRCAGTGSVTASTGWPTPVSTW